MSTYRVYKDAAGGWRWRLVAANGKIVADGAEGYTRRRDCIRAIERTRHLAITTVVWCTQ